MVNFEAVRNLLESQGKLDFKPFCFDNAKQEYWAYRTVDNHFHICDNNLIDLKWIEIGLSSWSLFVLNTNSKYSLLHEYESISDIKDNNYEDSITEVWYVNCHGVIERLDIQGFAKINDQFTILEPKKIMIENHNTRNRFWTPTEKILCYYNGTDELKDTETYYCGSFNERTLLFENDNYYLTEEFDYGENRLKCTKPVFWFTCCSVYLFDLDYVNEILTLSIYDSHLHLLNRGQFCVNKFDDMVYFCDDNGFIIYLKNDELYSFWISIDKDGKIINGKENFITKIEFFSNSVLKVKCPQSNEKWDFVDNQGNVLAKEIDGSSKYTIVSKLFTSSYSLNNNNRIIFKGIMNTQTHEIIVPIQYTNLELFDGGDYFYAIIGEVYTNKTGTKVTQYGLIYNSDVILPCNKVEIKSLRKNIFVWKEGEKYGLIFNGKICSECLYTKMEIVEERTILADGKLYKLKDSTLVPKKDMSDFDYLGGLRGYHLFRYKDCDIDNIDNYICFYLPDEDWLEEGVWDLEVDDEIEADREHILWGNYRPVLALGDGTVFYSVKEDCFYDDINDLASYPDYYPDDNYDYERDTYYALGGDDYDKWKEDGGDLDAMMDSMGL